MIKTLTLTVSLPQLGVVDGEPSVASASRGLPRAAPSSGSHALDGAILKTQFRLQAELGFFVFGKHLAGRSHERQVADHIIADLSRTLKLRYNLPSFQESVQLVVDILVGELRDRSLTLSPL